jgi:hypothetical protein
VILGSTYLFGLELRVSIREIAISITALLCIGAVAQTIYVGAPRFAVRSCK